MKTNVVKPQDVFFNPVRLVVPLFQRPYVWSQDTQWEPLWRDIVRLMEVIERHDAAATHFLGAIVIQQVPVGLGALPAWHVIDGQQRLTTLQLLLDALHSELERRGWSTLAGRVHALVENPRDHWDSPEDRFKLWPTNRDRDGFTAVMSAVPPVDYDALSANRLRDGHRFFAQSIVDWLGDGDDAERRARTLVATVIERLEIASISLDANEDAQAIFETLNARGTPLSAADLIKNFVFQQIDAADAERAYLTHWAEFETPWWETEVTTGRVKHTRSSLFLWQWMVARTHEDFPIREVFTQFKHHVMTAEKDVAALLPKLKASADRYRAVVEGALRPDGPLERMELFGYRVGTLDSEVARPLMIWLDEPEQAEISAEGRDRVLGALESWLVRRALVKAPSQGSNRFIVDLLGHLAAKPAAEVADAATAYLAANHTAVGYWPSDAEVRAALTGATVYWDHRRGRLRMVLEALEDRQRGYPNGMRLAMGPIVRGKGTIEHLMPQRWAKHWDDGLSEEELSARDRAVQTLGNLTIVTQSLNSRVSNATWERKREHFLTSDDVLITKQALAMSTDGVWNEERIAQRGDQMIAQILEIWPVPEGHVGLNPGERRAHAKVAVDLADLVAAGWLEAGVVLTMQRPGFDEARAAVAQDGRVFVGETAFDTPSAAAREVLGRGANGWWVWALEGGERLSEVRERYLASLGEADVEVVDEA